MTAWTITELLERAEELGVELNAKTTDSADLEPGDPCEKCDRWPPEVDEKNYHLLEIAEKCNHLRWLVHRLDESQRAVLASSRQQWTISAFLPGRTGALTLPMTRDEVLASLASFERMQQSSLRDALAELRALEVEGENRRREDRVAKTGGDE